MRPTPWSHESHKMLLLPLISLDLCQNFIQKIRAQKKILHGWYGTPYAQVSTNSLNSLADVNTLGLAIYGAIQLNELYVGIKHTLS